MQLSPRKEKIPKIVLLFFLLLLAAPAAVQDATPGDPTHKKQTSEDSTGRQVRIPNRASTSQFSGAQGKQKPEIHFNPATRMVTLKLLVQDPNGYFIPNIRRDNFVVYENGVRQQIVSVEIEHAAVSLGLLMEFGGRTQALNRLLGLEVVRAGHQLLDVLGHEDKIAIWKYGDKVDRLADFSQGREVLDQLFQNLGSPEFSETNLYDALIYVLEQMKPVKSRKGLILISSGVDTFSKAKYEDALKAAQDSDTPIYVISLAPQLRRLVEMDESKGPLAHIDWSRIDKQLQEIARASGGRAYSPETTIDLSATYDDIMENLRVRYVITYRSSNDLDLNSRRTVRVELVDPRTGGPLKIVDESGRTIHASIIAQDSYIPSAASGDSR
jgi:VWFA-related protein